MPAHMLQNSMLGNIYLKLNIFNTSYFVQYKYIHLVQTYPFNIKNSLLNTIFIQHITFYSIQICSVNADIFNTDIVIQCKFFIFNNPWPSAARSHDLFLQFGGKHKLLRLRSF